TSSTVGPARGVLPPGAPDGESGSHRRFAPSPDLAPYIAHFWCVSWRLERPRWVETLPHPTVHVVVEAGRAQVLGVPAGRFRRRLRGDGQVFGVKFRPAAFRPVLGAPMWTLTDRRTPASSLFGPAAHRYARDVSAATEWGERIAIAEAF